VPLDQIAAFAKTAAKRRTIVAYCRGPYCVLSLQAVSALRKRGLTVMRSEDGVTEWRAAGLPLEHAERAAP
jgi:rhodanese-related sulfurtransferase